MKWRNTWKRARHITIAISALVVVCGTQAAPEVASAHELKTDKGVSAVLHINPDDDPKSGQDTLLLFYFSSGQPGFDLAHCACQVSYRSSDGVLHTAPITADQESKVDGSATVHFDKDGVYDLNVRGLVATDPSDYFSFTYRERVEAGTSAEETASRQAAGWQIILLSLTSVVILGVIANAMIRRGTHYQKLPAATMKRNRI